MDDEAKPYEGALPAQGGRGRREMGRRAGGQMCIAVADKTCATKTR